MPLKNTGREAIPHATKPWQGGALEELPRSLPTIAIRDVVMFPHMALPLSVDRKKSVNALEAAMEGNRLVLAVTQHQPQTDDPAPENLFQFGVVSEVAQSLKMPDNTLKVFHS